MSNLTTLCESCKEAPAKFTNEDGDFHLCQPCLVKKFARDITVAAIDAGFPDAKTAVQALVEEQKKADAAALRPRAEDFGAAQGHATTGGEDV